MNADSVQTRELFLPPIGSDDDHNRSKLPALQLLLCGAGNGESLKRNVPIEVNCEGCKVDEVGIIMLFVCQEMTP